MKKIIFGGLFFMFATFLSASTTPAVDTLIPENRWNLRFMDAKKIKVSGTLLALGDSSVLFKPRRKDPIVVPVTDLDRLIYKHPHQIGRGIGQGAVWGFVVGFAFGFLLTQQSSSKEGSFHFSPVSFGLGFGAIGTIPGAIIGGLTMSLGAHYPISGKQTNYQIQKELLKVEIESH